MEICGNELRGSRQAEEITTAPKLIFAKIKPKKVLRDLKTMQGNSQIVQSVGDQLKRSVIFYRTKCSSELMKTCNKNKQNHVVCHYQMFYNLKFVLVLLALNIHQFEITQKQKKIQNSQHLFALRLKKNSLQRLVQYVYFNEGTKECTSSNSI